MQFRPTIALMCAILLLPISSAAAQIRLSGTGVLATVTAPFEAFSTGNVQFEFELPQPPNGAPLDPAAFLLEGLSGRFSQGNTQVNVIGDLLFYTAAFDGGFSFESPVGTFLLNTFGQQLFIGDVTSPLLQDGEFALENLAVFPAVLAVQGNVSLTTVPEPSTLLLLIAGGGLLAVVAQRRRAW